MPSVTQRCGRTEPDDGAASRGTLNKSGAFNTDARHRDAEGTVARNARRLREESTLYPFRRRIISHKHHRNPSSFATIAAIFTKPQPSQNDERITSIYSIAYMILQSFRFCVGLVEGFNQGFNKGGSRLGGERKLPGAFW